jgi:hypothetical protein
VEWDAVSIHHPHIPRPWNPIRALSKTTLPGYAGFLQFLRNVRQHNAFKQAELILYAALDPTITSRARKGEFVRCIDHFDLLQTQIN